ncbi:MAG TPA: DUF4037 domain-containing protein, partial [Thermomicrobiales bacterium]
MPAFIPGLQLSEAFYREAVAPILDAAFPGLIYAAALIGNGSDVLGYDTARSTDHGWGPRCWLFLPDADDAMYRNAINETLREHLPHTFRGYPTNFTRAAHGSLLLEAIDAGPVNHQVRIASLPRFFIQQLGFDPTGERTAVDWLSCPQQALLEMTRGAVFHDGFGVLTAARERLAYYPDDVWRTLLAAQWQRISQEEAFVGRCGEVGDELGSAVVAARLGREIMRLCFLMERQYAPYSKWLGTAFAGLICGPMLVPILCGALHAQTWQERDRPLGVAYETVARMHNDLGITAPLDPRTGHYHGRPFKEEAGRPFTVIHAERFAEAIRATIADEMLRAVASFTGG